MQSRYKLTCSAVSICTPTSSSWHVSEPTATGCVLCTDSVWHTFSTHVYMPPCGQPSYYIKPFTFKHVAPKTPRRPCFRARPVARWSADITNQLCTLTPWAAACIGPQQHSVNDKLHFEVLKTNFHDMDGQTPAPSLTSKLHTLANGLVSSTVYGKASSQWRTRGEMET